MTGSAPRPSLPLPSVGVSLAVGLLFAACTWDAYGIDVEEFLRPWFQHIRAAGPVGAFATPFSNYMPPYLYLMAAVSPLAGILPYYVVLKLLSFAGHGMLVLAVRQLLASLGHSHPGRAAAVLALAPSLFLNPAILTQCDALWAAALVLALAAAVERRHAAMFALCGLAVAIKLQAAFAGPFFLAVAIAHRVPLRLWLWAPLAFAAALVPAWAAGWPASDLLTIYLRQTAWEDTLSLSAPNIWAIVQPLPMGDWSGWSGLATAAAAVAAGGYVVVFAGHLRDADGETLVRAACLCVLLVPGLLPRMHERYFFLSDVLALIVVLIRPAAWRTGVFTQVGSSLALLAYLSGARDLAILGAVATIAATWLLARPFVAELVSTRPRRALAA